MTKKNLSGTPENNDDVWGTHTQEARPLLKEPKVKADAAVTAVIPTPEQDEKIYDIDLGYDLEGLKTDFPTATDLAKFVFDETGYALNFKGRSNELKYRIALDVLNGRRPPSQFLTKDNPYLDKGDLVPEETLKPIPPRDPHIRPNDRVQNTWYSPFVPHTDADMRAMDKKVDVIFRKYISGLITYEVLGPLDQRAEGDKIDRFGRRRPEIIRWVDPRTGEQVAQFADGTMTPIGRKLKAMMRSLPFNKTNHWDQWVDRDFVNTNEENIANPWGVA